MTDQQDEEEGLSGMAKTANAADSPARYLFTVDGEKPRDALEIVCDLVADAGAELFLGAPITVPEQTPLAAEQPQNEGDRLVAKYTLEAKSTCADEVSTINEVVRVGHHRDATIADMVDSFGITTLIEETVPETGFRSIFNGEFDERGVGETCDVITVSRIAHLESIDSILVPVAAGPHAGFAIDVALSLARQNDADVELVHVEDASASTKDRVGDRVLTKGMERVRGFDAVTRTLVESESVSQEILEYAENYDITVMGAPREGLLKQFVSGTIPSKVSAQAKGAVLTAHRAGVESSWLDRWI